MHCAGKKYVTCKLVRFVLHTAKVCKTRVLCVMRCKAAGRWELATASPLKLDTIASVMPPNLIYSNAASLKSIKKWKSKKMQRPNPLNMIFSNATCMKGTKRSIEKVKNYSGGTKIPPFWLFLAPPADPVEFFWFKMAGKGVPHIDTCSMLDSHL